MQHTEEQKIFMKYSMYVYNTWWDLQDFKESKYDFPSLDSGTDYQEWAKYRLTLGW